MLPVAPAGTAGVAPPLGLLPLAPNPLPVAPVDITAAEAMPSAPPVPPTPAEAKSPWSAPLDESRIPRPPTRGSGRGQEAAKAARTTATSASIHSRRPKPNPNVDAPRHAAVAPAGRRQTTTPAVTNPPRPRGEKRWVRTERPVALCCNPVAQATEPTSPPLERERNELTLKPTRRSSLHPPVGTPKRRKRRLTQSTAGRAAASRARRGSSTTPPSPSPPSCTATPTKNGTRAGRQGHARHTRHAERRARKCAVGEGGGAKGVVWTGANAGRGNEGTDGSARVVARPGARGGPQPTAVLVKPTSRCPGQPCGAPAARKRPGGRTTTTPVGR